LVGQRLAMTAIRPYDYGRCTSAPGRPWPANHAAVRRPIADLPDALVAVDHYRATTLSSAIAGRLPEARRLDAR